MEESSILTGETPESPLHANIDIGSNLQQQRNSANAGSNFIDSKNDGINPIIIDNGSNAVTGGGVDNGIILPGSRRPQTHIIPPSVEQRFLIPTQLLQLTIHKDSNGYGMKVSGDNPVFVESVKPGGAAQKAGLVAGDMILKVNDTPVRYSKHTHVVQLIKSNVVVELTVQRAQKMQRPTSVGIGPGTPLPQRDRITGPQPVDNAKRREMEFSKIKTLKLMLEQEKKNLENLKSTNTPNSRQERAKAETNIRKLQEQLRQVGGEDPTFHLFTPAETTQNIQTPATTPQSHNHSSPAFLSRFPRSLSSLSLGTRKKNDKELTSPINNSSLHNTDALSSNPSNSPQQFTHHQQQTKYPQQPGSTSVISTKTKYSPNERYSSDIPPPLPQRNPPRKNVIAEETNEALWRKNMVVSDLDHSMAVSLPSPKAHTVITSGQGFSSSSKSSSGKKRTKTKTKALSDPKMSTQMFLQMEKGNMDSTESRDTSVPPPLPPRQPGMMEENQNIINNNKMLNTSVGNSGMSSSSSGLNCSSSMVGSSNHSVSGNSGNQCRPLPNSIETLMNYPLVATCTSVRDNMSPAFPLSQRPNIVQQLQQHQQNLQQLQQNILATNPSINKAAALGQTPQHMSHFNKHRRVVSSPEHIPPRYDRQLDRHNKSSSGSWELLEKDNESTPPGTPPPPYLSTHTLQSQGNMNIDDTDNIKDPSCTAIVGSPTIPTFPNQIIAAQANITQKEIISMEDEEISDQECVIDEHGPFNYLQRLLEQENVAHLAVFLNYVLSNSDPAPLLFYLITGLYKEGSVKDMQKWAYEIHSTFLVPCAPLLWFNVDESLARDVDNVLQNEYNKVEILRKVFWKSRKKAKEKICDQLRDFQQKRTAGLGTMYGPSDQQLTEAKGDRNKEQKIFEETLLPKLQQLFDEMEKEAPVECPKKMALCSALSTVLSRIFVTRPIPNSPIDRVHHFVSREKSFKSRLMSKSRKMVVRGHPLVLQQYHEVTHCNHCQTIIWGVSPQGFQCTDCKLNIHRSCSKILEESCPGPVPQKRKEPAADNKISKFMGKIRPAHHFAQNERQRRLEEDSAMEEYFLTDRPHSTSVVRQPSDRRPDVSNTSTSSGHTQNTSELVTSQSLDTDTNVLDSTDPDSKRGERPKSKSAPVSVNRSESYKERLSHKRNRANRRKTSDPSLSKTNDEQSETGLSNSNFSGSSSSSLSSNSLESPSLSLEQVSGPGVNIGYNASIGAGNATTPRHWVDSDDEGDPTDVCWTSNIPVEVLSDLSDAEKERQQVINELYETERNHVRTLKLLEGIFMRPLQESGVLPQENLQLLFPAALGSLKDLHGSFEQRLKQRRIDHGYLVRSIGDLLVVMFEGQTGDELKEYAAQFCARQQIALEALKERRRKDEHLHKFLTKAESHKACRRLQLKDLLPTVLQRITKYPLLFEKLAKITKYITPDEEAEINALHSALDSSKRILIYVNQAVKHAEDAHKLQNIQRKLDKSIYDKDASNEFRNLDLTQHRLVHDGPLIMKKIPGIQLHGLLFENMMVLLQKQDDKYFIKYFPNLSAGGNEGRGISPITNFDQQTLVRQSAVDKNTFFLIITKTSQMLELTAPSSNECKIWFKHISDAAEQYKPRSKSSHEVVEDPASTVLPHSNTRDSLENTPERITPLTTNNNANEEAYSNVTQQETDNESEIPSSNVASNDKQTFVSNNNLNRRNSRKNENINLSSSNSINNKVNNNNITNQVSKSEDTSEINKNRVEPNYGNRENVRSGGDNGYANSSENARTLMQPCALLEPSDVRISISPALTAEPVVTPAERLRRLDEAIRERLAEKQQIICDMFRVPSEHFATIADIAGQPEAQNDPSEVVLAAFAQVQSLTEILNEYMKVTPEQEISAVSTAVCDQCHYRNLRSISPLPSSISSTNTASTVQNNSTQSSFREADPNEIILQEDDGYCEIDALRLPSVKHNLSNLSSSGQRASLPVAASMVTSTPELVKRQSTISTDSIKEESEQDVTNEEKLVINDSSEQNPNKDNLATMNVAASSTETVRPPESDDTGTSNDGKTSLNTFDKSAICEKSVSNTNGQLLTKSLELCGPNRTSHVQSLEPAVPCHIISGIITTLNAQISLLLPKINERDSERERLRKENQHLRELLNSMHERQRVQEEMETPDSEKGCESKNNECQPSKTQQVDDLCAVIEEA